MPGSMASELGLARTADGRLHVAWKELTKRDGAGTQYAQIAHTWVTAAGRPFGGTTFSKDDWVGLSLDALGTAQLSYHLLVNPSGIQLDMINTTSGNEDTAPDYVWDSAGRVNDRGYAVEIRLPLQSIRFKGGSDIRMGVLFWRRVSRTGVSVSWPALQPGKWVFETHAPLLFGVHGLHSV